MAGCETCQRRKRYIEENTYWVTNIPQNDSVWQYEAGGLQIPRTWYLCGGWNNMTQIEVDELNREYRKKYGKFLPPFIEKNRMRGKLS